ncbi:aminoacyl-histidine dipeptidase [bacterium]|nr:aminoacyl-histidine dipeptidase [bacterium]
MNKKTEAILNLFEEINKVPRQSKHEEKISAWLVDWAKDHGLEAERDESMNVLIKAPATPGYEDKPIIVMQGHMDMVCEKIAGSSHDFSKDPIKCIVDGDWLKADGTTLGADDGIALAISLLLATDKDVVHPPLELLFTIDEETGLTGANTLKPGWLDGKILLNIDTEDEGVFTIGCAGGRDTMIEFEYTPVEVPADDKVYELRVWGLAGGHSGVDINLPRGNSNMIAARILDEAARNAETKLVFIEGGSAHNAIPRETKVVFSADKDLTSVLGALREKIISEIGYAEPNMKIDITPAVNNYRNELNAKDTKKLVAIMMAMPHGVAAMSKDIEGLPETSNNFATIKMVMPASKGGLLRNETGSVSILSSQRSSVESRLDWISRKIEAIAVASGAKTSTSDGYPSWEPNMESPLNRKCVDIYKKLFGKEPRVEVIHAGLECGIIGSKNEGMEMISFGPTIKNPHTPDERLEIPTVQMVWDFTVELLKDYCK